MRCECASANRVAICLSNVSVLRARYNFVALKPLEGERQSRTTSGSDVVRANQDLTVTRGNGSVRFLTIDLPNRDPHTVALIAATM